MNFKKAVLILILLSLINQIYSQQELNVIQEDSLSSASKISNNQNMYLEQKKSVIGNGLKSLFFPGWGNIKRGWLYGGIEILVFVSGIMVIKSRDGYAGLGWMSLAIPTLCFNHIVSPIDAMSTTYHYNLDLKKKYNISIIPIYMQRDNGVGLVFSVNF